MLLLVAGPLFPTPAPGPFQGLYANQDMSLFWFNHSMPVTQQTAPTQTTGQNPVEMNSTAPAGSTWVITMHPYPKVNWQNALANCQQQGAELFVASSTEICCC